MTHQYALSNEEQEKFNQFKQMSPEAYEKICKRCGLCCLYKAHNSHYTIATRYCCKHLDTKTQKCKIYNNRTSYNSNDCISVVPDMVLDGTILPRTCGYVEYVFGPAPIVAKINWKRVKNVGDTIPDANKIRLKDFIWGSKFWYIR